MESSPRPPLAIVGASARAAAYSALRAGFQPVTADLFADLDLRRIATATRIAPYPEGLVDWLRTIQPPAWMYTGALENHPDLIDEMAWIAPLCGNSGDVLTRIRSPVELGASLGEAGFLFPETRVSAEGLPRDGSWLVKTYRGASGSGIRELAETSTNVSDFSSSVTPLYFQRRVAGIPCAAVFCALDATSMMEGITRQLIGEAWLGAHGFQFAGSIGLRSIPNAVEQTLEQVGILLTRRFELSGLFGVDFILDGDQVWILEVNPRYTASVEVCERATGANSIVTHLTDWPNVKIAGKGSVLVPKRAHGKAILFAKRGVTISPPFVDWALEKSLTMPWPELADISPAGTPIDVGRPVLTVFATGATDADVEQNLRDRVAAVESRLYSVKE
jgi:predicted ATP-grasp superfamily ATP-dependent carboligase